MIKYICRKFGIVALVIMMFISAAVLLTNLWLPAKALIAHQLIVDSWQQMQANSDESIKVKPWPWADTHAIAELSFPRLDQQRIVLQGADPTTLAFSIGAMHGFDRFDNDKPFVIAGHRDTHFNVLADVKLDDVIIITVGNNQQFRYQVSDIKIVDTNAQTENTSWQLPDDPTLLVLITCYPFDALTVGGSQRYLVFASKTK